MSQSKEFQFNLPIGAISEDDGAFDKKAHADLIKPVRGQLMQINGVTGCEIGRYGLVVQYLERLVSNEQLAYLVPEAVMKAFESHPELFPTRGEQVPVVEQTYAPRQARESTRQCVTVTFNTSLLKLPTKGKGDYDHDEFNTRIASFREKLTDLDGVVGVTIALLYASVTVETTVTPVSALERHIDDVLARFTESNADGLFPYLEGEPLRATFAVAEA